MGTERVIAYDNEFDLALVMSADSDLAPPIEAVRRRFAGKTILVAAPPKRWSSELKRVAHATVKISPGAIRRNRLPDPVITPNGQQLRASENVRNCIGSAGSISQC